MSPASDTSASEKLLLESFQARTESPEELFGMVYEELRKVARAYMRKERPDHTLQTTALVNEAYLRLFNGQGFQWDSRQHLLCTVAKIMRRVLMDHARKRGAKRHGGALKKITLDEQGLAIYKEPEEFLALGEALDQLALVNSRQAKVVELHSFAGLTEEETAEVLGVCLKTVRNDWRFAKAWLKSQIGEPSA
jgi:RNA polymerase sigma factor (TIGR02999 family)